MAGGMTETQRNDAVAMGARVRASRKKARLSQTKLADALGITFQQVQKYEKGANRIPGTKITAISKALAVPVSYIIGGEEPEISEDALTLARAYDKLPMDSKLSVRTIVSKIQDHAHVS